MSLIVTNIFTVICLTLTPRSLDSAWWYVGFPFSRSPYPNLAPHERPAGHIAILFACPCTFLSSGLRLNRELYPATFIPPFREFSAPCAHCMFSTASTAPPCGARKWCAYPYMGGTRTTQTSLRTSSHTLPPSVPSHSETHGLLTSGPRYAFVCARMCIASACG